MFHFTSVTKSKIEMKRRNDDKSLIKALFINYNPGTKPDKSMTFLEHFEEKCAIMLVMLSVTCPKVIKSDMTVSLAH